MAMMAYGITHCSKCLQPYQNGFECDCTRKEKLEREEKLSMLLDLSKDEIRALIALVKKLNNDRGFLAKENTDLKAKLKLYEQNQTMKDCIDTAHNWQDSYLNKMKEIHELFKKYKDIEQVGILEVKTYEIIEELEKIFKEEYNAEIN